MREEYSPQLMNAAPNCCYHNSLSLFPSMTTTETNKYSLFIPKSSKTSPHRYSSLHNNYSLLLFIISFLLLFFFLLSFIQNNDDHHSSSSSLSERTCPSFFFIHAAESSSNSWFSRLTNTSTSTNTWSTSFYDLFQTLLSILAQCFLSLYEYLLVAYQNLLLPLFHQYHGFGATLWSFSSSLLKNITHHHWSLALYALSLMIVLALVKMCYSLIQRKYKERASENEKRETMRKQRLATLYEILVSERQYCEYLKVLYEQYYLPLEKGETSYQLEITRSTSTHTSTVKTTTTTSSLNHHSNNHNSNNNNHPSGSTTMSTTTTTTTTTTASSNGTKTKYMDSQEEEEGQESKTTAERSIIDFKSIHTLKDSTMVLIPPELENIYKLNQELLKCLESEILGWHAKDRFLYNVYRYSMNVIGSLFNKSTNNASSSSNGSHSGSGNIHGVNTSNGSLSSLLLTSSSSYSESIPTSRPLPIPPGTRSPARHIRTGSSSSGDLMTNNGAVENFGYDLKQVREDCNIAEKCFNKFMHAFTMYAFYISKFNQCRMNVNELSNQYPEFQTNLRLAKTQLKPANSLDLASLSVMIPQRLPRYVLLMKQLAKCTNLNESPHQFKEIEQCVKELEKITFKVNAFVKEYQSQMLVVNLQEELNKKVPLFKQEQQDGLIPYVVQPYRKVIGSFKVTPLVINSGSDNDGSASPSSNSGLLTPRTGSSSVTSIPSMEIHVLNDVLIVVASKTKTILKPKNEVDSSAVGNFLKLLTPRKKDKHVISSPSDIARNEIVDTRHVYEIYYCDNHNVSLHTSQKVPLLPIHNAVSTTTSTPTSKNSTPSSRRSSSASDSSDGGGATGNHNTLILELSKCKYYSFASKSQTKKEEQQSRQLTKMIHLDKTHEMTQLFVQCFEKLERPNTVFKMSEDEEGENLISNSKLLTLLTPENLVLTALNSNK
ncbi:hypothetical protein C9374_003903 [Naegleria lovaniensis]|uniref:DH domain-containing protein n=1 Tax=Naegleria lovaniensis TaxID=51637 RepID=A0AA88H0U6_NAELO|nr:uncharacterized protein C9374_003903 [Naegleria lovaniensis]KAG2394139.1 hypothetical protein C9374_003903 [Naegleria lovaniensis]